ncbi:MAG: hypothetical protein ACLFWM_05420 [Actinomycetota bacterium]
MEILDAPDRWIIEWSGTATSRKMVRLRNRWTGQVAVGYDWQDWDRALQRALDVLRSEGDLISEVEDYLRGP